MNLAEVDRSFVERAFRAARGNKSKAARLLNLSRGQLSSRLVKYGIRQVTPAGVVRYGLSESVQEKSAPVTRRFALRHNAEGAGESVCGGRGSDAE